MSMFFPSRPLSPTLEELFRPREPDESDLEFSFDASDPFSFLPPDLRPPYTLTPEEGREQIRTKREILFHTWNKLHAILLTHEETIRKRWTKRTAIKRRELLLEVQSDIPKEHASDVEALLETNLTDFNGVKFPSEFVMMDYNLQRFGVVNQAIKRPYIPDYSMLAYGGKETYGKVIAWTEALDNHQDSSSGLELAGAQRDALPSSEEIPLLEAQNKLLDLLRRVVCRILIDMDLKNISSPSVPIKMPPPEISLDQSSSSFSWMSTARTNSLRPYIQPFAYSFEELRNSIQTGHQIAADHLIDLRTDPTCLHDQLNLYMEHRMEAVASPPAPRQLIQRRALCFVKGFLFQIFHIALSIIDQMESHLMTILIPHLKESDFSRTTGRCPIYEGIMRFASTTEVPLSDVP
ncbi:hypothetical protein M422DRAFT_243171 [Sphaerobolus stellatus SS14]|nr:hypothetical protein M422DRAFT_243171 [Sphaerobolus stellatus SS14]